MTFPVKSSFHNSVFDEIIITPCSNSFELICNDAHLSKIRILENFQFCKENFPLIFPVMNRFISILYIDASWGEYGAFSIHREFVKRKVTQRNDNYNSLLNKINKQGTPICCK